MSSWEDLAVHEIVEGIGILARRHGTDAETLGRAVLLLEALVLSRRIAPAAAFRAIGPRLFPDWRYVCHPGSPTPN
jgi:hypothetical protein